MTIRYIDRTRRYYQALGYGAPYEWARFEVVPFTPLAQGLQDTRVTLITTAAPFQAGRGDQGPGAAYNAAAKFYAPYTLPVQPMPDLRISHVAIDRAHTTAEDMASYFPLAALMRAVEAGAVNMTEGFHGLPTNRSQKTTLEVDAPDILRRCREGGTGAAILIPNCPVCHQSCALAARVLEDGGIPTVIMGAARDIVEHVGVPRLLFSDVPLGNAAGLPGDVASQDRVLAEALELLATANAPRTTVQSSLVWPGPSDWREDYSNPDKLTAKEIAERRAAFDAGKAAAKGVREGL